MKINKENSASDSSCWKMNRTKSITEVEKDEENEEEGKEKEKVSSVLLLYKYCY